MDRLPMITVLMALAVPKLAAAQLPDLRPGDRIQIGYAKRVRPTRSPCPQAHSREVFGGWVASADADTLRLRTDRCDALVAIPAGSINEVWRLEGSRRNTLGGMAGGAVFLGLAGMGASLLCASEEDCLGPDPVAAAGAGVLVGAFLGAIIGSLSNSDHWVRLPRDRARLALTPRPGSVSVGLTLSF